MAPGPRMSGAGSAQKSGGSATLLLMPYSLFLCIFFVFIFISNAARNAYCLCTSRAVDPHSFFGDPDPYFFLNADPDPEPALQNM